MKKITSGTVILQNYNIYELSGMVLSENTRSETSVSGSVTDGGGGFGGGVHGTVSSNTTRYQTIYIKGDDDKEYAAELVDLIIPCREGHSLTLWGINQGWWFEGINHTTKQASKSKQTLINFTMPSRTIGGGAILVGILSWMLFAGVFDGDITGIGILWGLIGALICAGLAYILFLVPGKIVSVIRSRQISTDKERHTKTVIGH